MLLAKYNKQTIIYAYRFATPLPQSYGILLLFSRAMFVHAVRYTRLTEVLV